MTSNDKPETPRTTLEELTERVIFYRDARDWKQFHNPKDLAISLSLEASEFLEHFQWKTPEEITDRLTNKREDIEDELADVLYYVLLTAHDLNMDIGAAFQRKMAKNEAKYPVEKAKGRHTKYTELENG